MSVKVVRGSEVASLHYPPPGRYTFRYSLSSGTGTWRAAKAYRAGLNFNHPLLAVSVVDRVSAKSLPPTHAFCAFGADNLIISAFKKADRAEAIVLRAYEIEGTHANATIRCLGQPSTCTELNLLEEDLGLPAAATVKFDPHQIKTFRLNVRG